MEHNPNRKNQILLACLMKKCTSNDLKIVCDVMIGISGNFRMAALGHDMKRELETGKYYVRVYACVRVCACVCVCVCVCV